MVQLKHITILIFATLISSSTVLGQEEYKLIKKGNKNLEKEQFTEAETKYLKALALPEQQDKANYYLGNAIYKQERFEDAQERFEIAANDLKESKQRAAAYHNLGNTFLEREEYEKSINQYKNALKQNPDDMETKYNLAYAQKMLKKEQEQEQQNQDNEEEQEEEEKDSEEQEENEDEGDSEEEKEDDKGEEGEEEKNEDSESDGDEEEKENDGEEEEKEAPAQPQQVNLTKGEAEQLLKALAGEEAKLQDKMEEEALTPVDIIIDKDW